jgi:hypothetical protein
LALFPLIVAWEYGLHDHYIPGVEFVFATFGFIGSIVGIALNVLDYKNGSILNRTQKKVQTAKLDFEDETNSKTALLADSTAFNESECI